VHHSPLTGEEETLLNKAGLAVKRRAADCLMARAFLPCKTLVGSGLRERMAQWPKMLKWNFWMNRYGGSALLATRG
jgi:hypothetical protein